MPGRRTRAAVSRGLGVGEGSKAGLVPRILTIPRCPHSMTVQATHLVTAPMLRHRRPSPRPPSLPSAPPAWTRGGRRLVFAPGPGRVPRQAHRLRRRAQPAVRAEQGICFAYVPRSDTIVRLLHPATGTRCEFALDAGLARRRPLVELPDGRGPQGGAEFPRPPCGADVAVHGDLPPAAGLSSSSALIVGTFLVLSGANRLSERPEYRAAIRSPEDLAGYLGCVENGQTFTGTGGAGGARSKAVAASAPSAAARTTPPSSAAGGAGSVSTASAPSATRRTCRSRPATGSSSPSPASPPRKRGQRRRRTIATR